MKNSLILYLSRLGRAQQRSAIPGATRTGYGILSAPLWPSVAIILLLAVATISPRPVAGFSIDANLTNGTPTDRSDDLLDAARWSDSPGSLVRNRVRGLGGGLEYSISPAFCTSLIPQFIDSPSCDELRLSIQQTFDIWAQDHPKLRFEDVSDRVRAELPTSGVRDPWRGFGAEIDLLALSADQYANVGGFGAWTQFWYLFADPRGTNRRTLPGNSLTSADIVINSQACFYLDPAMAVAGCNDFGFLLLHETGHVFGIDHSSRQGNGYFDSDFDPFNPMLIDCDSPHKGLELSPFADPLSVMNLDQWELGQVRMELSADEVGALRFLYPVCTGAGS